MCFTSFFNEFDNTPSLKAADKTTSKTLVCLIRELALSFGFHARWLNFPVFLTVGLTTVLVDLHKNGMLIGSLTIHVSYKSL